MILISQLYYLSFKGQGLFTIEEHLYSPDGFIYTRGPGLYHVPMVKDIPREFNISLLKNGVLDPGAQLYKSKVTRNSLLFFIFKRGVAPMPYTSFISCVSPK